MHASVGTLVYVAFVKAFARLHEGQTRALIGLESLVWHPCQNI